MSKTIDEIVRETRDQLGSALSPDNRGLARANTQKGSLEASDRKMATVLVTHGHAPNEPVFQGMIQIAAQLRAVGITPLRAIPRPDGTFKYVEFESADVSFKGDSAVAIESFDVTSVVVPALDAAKNIGHIDRLALRLAGDDPDRTSVPIVLEAAGAEATRDMRTTWGSGIGNFLRTLGWNKITAIRFTTAHQQTLHDARQHLGANCEIKHRPGPSRSNQSNLDSELLGLVTTRPEIVAGLVREHTTPEIGRGHAKVADQLGIKTTPLGSEGLATNSGPGAGQGLRS